MTNKVIVYKNQNDGVSILRPAAEGLKAAGGNIVTLAQRDVPAGHAFAIVDASSIPTDRTFRNAWTIDDGELVDGVGNVSNVFGGK
ncbi:hypothetical protein NVP1101O_162 [Vibrio phage 1.101.O._10N.261.45.C6]|nr:hypothetical protein NVP1101O_162 [Vibrio phage 1.101.O._10N.261.45.C6]